MTATQTAPEIVVPPPVDLMTKVEAWPEKAKCVVVVDEATNKEAAEMLLGIKDLMQEVIDNHEPHKKKAHELWKGLCTQMNRHMEPLEKAEKILKASIGAFAMKQQQLLEAEQRRHDEEVRKAEQEARRLAEEQLERDIEAAEQVGAAPEEIEAMIAAPIEVVPAYVPPPPTRTVAQPKGISVPMKDVVRVDSKQMLVSYLAANSQFLNLVEVNQGALDKMAAVAKAMNWPGVTVTKQPVVRAGGRY